MYFIFPPFLLTTRTIKCSHQIPLDFSLRYPVVYSLHVSIILSLNIEHFDKYLISCYQAAGASIPLIYSLSVSPLLQSIKH